MKLDISKARQLITELQLPDTPITSKIEKQETLVSMMPAALDRIAELEEALIEERANSVGSMAAMSGRLMDCIEAEKEARGQLHSEGKI